MSTLKTSARWAAAFSLTILFSFGLASEANAQGVLDRLEKKVERKVERKVDKKVDETIDRKLDKAEDAVDGNGGKKNKNNKNNKDSKNSKTADADDPGSNKNNKSNKSGKDGSDGKSTVASDSNKPKRVNYFAAQASASSGASMQASDVKIAMVDKPMVADMGAPDAKTMKNNQPDTKSNQPETKTNQPDTKTSNPVVSNNGNAGNDKPEVKANNSGNESVSEGSGYKGWKPKSEMKTSSPKDVVKTNNAGWKNYDFVPGELVIFADNQAKARNGEFPNDFKLLKGSAEYADLGAEKAVSFLGIPTEIAPRMKTEAFLPQAFTAEFDAYFYSDPNQAYVLRFKGMEDIAIRLNSAAMGDFNGYTTDNVQDETWRHIAVIYNSRGMKVYIDQHRIVNIPKVETRPSSFTIYTENNGAKTGDRAMIKNFRLFDANVVPVERFSAEGKMVARGITFMPGSTKMNDESAGTLNMVAKMMDEDPALNLNIEVHIDKTGDPSSELQELTQQRADAVKAALMGRGVNGSRLTTKGWGDFKPVDTNDTAAGRENNRRVEFIKQ